MHLDDIVRLPRFFEERFQWSVEAEESEPAFARHRLDPVPLLTCGFRSEINVNGAVGIGLRARIGAYRRKGLTIAQDRTAVGIIGYNRPKVLDWDIRRNMQTIIPAAVKKRSARVARRPEILRT